MNEAVFVGPLPPPIHGFSLINSRFLEMMRGYSKVHVFDVAPPTISGFSLLVRMRRVFLLPLLLVRFFYVSVRPAVKLLYMGVSGGYGQLLDLCFIILFGALGKSIYVHHHSYAYLIRRRWYNRVFFHFSKGATHIVLCEDMGQKISLMYDIEKSNIRAVSNAAFLEFPVASSSFSSVSDKIRCIGYLSNITPEKGIDDFLDLAKRFEDEGALRFVVAGPLVDDAYRAEFESSLAQLSNCVYVGPVYGEEKSSFFNMLDLFIFPTRYLNEAEPLVLWESFASGTPVISSARGCIPSMLHEGCGAITSSSVGFDMDLAEKRIRELLLSPAGWDAWKMAARNYFCSFRDDQVIACNALILSMFELGA